MGAFLLLATMLLPPLSVADESGAPPPLFLEGSANPSPGKSRLLAEEDWSDFHTQGVIFYFAPRDRVLAEWLWPYLLEDRKFVTETLRMFPSQPLQVVLAPTLAIFSALVPNLAPERTLGVYLLGRGIIVLRAPRTDLAGQWDPRSVLQHELVHAVIDMTVPQPVPIWLHEGMAILLSDDLGYLDEARLNWVALTGNLIPLAVLFDRFPHGHGSRELAYTQAASFVRFLMRRGGMGDLRRLLESLANGMALPGALAITYGESLPVLEAKWGEELTSPFSVLTVFTSTSMLGLVGIPLLLLAALRRRWQKARKFADWQLEQERSEGKAPGTSPGTGRFAPPFPPRPTSREPVTGDPVAGNPSPTGTNGSGLPSGRLQGSDEFPES